MVAVAAACARCVGRWLRAQQSERIRVLGQFEWRLELVSFVAIVFPMVVKPWAGAA
jgi:hypothetical protein